VGSCLELWCFLVDFFFLAAVELPCGDEALDCCGLYADEAAFAGYADVEQAHASDARNSDAAMGSLVIFLRFGSLPDAVGFGVRSVRREPSFIMIVFRPASSWDIWCGAYRATGAELDWMPEDGVGFARACERRERVQERHFTGQNRSLLRDVFRG